MAIIKPDLGELDWGLKLNAALDELGNKESIEGSASKATQAYTSAKEYTDLKVNQAQLEAGSVTSVVGEAGEVSADDIFDAIEGSLAAKIETAELAAVQPGAAPRSVLDTAYMTQARTQRSNDNFSSWWSTPNVWHIGGIWSRTYYTGCQRNGNLKVGYFDKRSGKVVESIIGWASSDDHNTPCLVFHPDQFEAKPLVAFWTHHQGDRYVRYRRTVRNAGDISEWGAEQTIDFGQVGGADVGVSYTQVFSSPQNANELHLFTRVRYAAGAGAGDEHWYYTYSTDYATTWSTPVQIIDFGTTQHCYMLGHGQINDATNATVNFAIYGHPTQSTTNEIRTFSVRLASGEVRIPGAVLGNVRTGVSLPIARASIPASVTPADGRLQRLSDVFGNAASRTAVVYMVWDSAGANAHKAEYWIAVRNVNAAGPWTYTKICDAGVPIGEKQEIHYHGGIFFGLDDANGGTVWLAREEAGVWYVEQWTATDQTNLTGWTMTKRLAQNNFKTGRVRPVYAQGALAKADRPFDVLWHEIFRYEDVDNAYLDYMADLVGGK